MRAVFGLVLLIGMGLAGFAVYMVNQYMDTQASQLERERQRSATAIRTVDIYAPTRSLTYGDLLTIEDVKIIKYARDFLPDGVFATEEELFPEGHKYTARGPHPYARERTNSDRKSYSGRGASGHYCAP